MIYYDILYLPHGKTCWVESVRKHRFFCKFATEFNHNPHPSSLIFCFIWRCYHSNSSSSLRVFYLMAYMMASSQLHEFYFTLCYWRGNEMSACRKYWLAIPQTISQDPTGGYTFRWTFFIVLFHLFYFETTTSLANARHITVFSQ